MISYPNATIPPDEDLRAHLMLMILYIEAFYKHQNQTASMLDAVIPFEDLMALRNKLFYADQKSALPLKTSETLLLYATAFCMTKLLLSKHDEAVLNYLRKALPQHIFNEDANKGSFSNFRKNAIQANVKLMEDTENRFNDFNEFKELKSALEQLQLEE